LNITASDQSATGGGRKISKVLVAITVLSVNDAPVLNIPAIQTADEDVLFSLATITLTDVDVAFSTLRVRVTAYNGTVALGFVGGITLTAGDGVSQLLSHEFTCTTASCNLVLASLQFLSDLNYNGPAAVSVFVSDEGATGMWGAMNTSGVALLTVSAVNDAPVVSGAVGVTGIEDYNVTIPGVIVADLDIGAAPFQVTVSVDYGVVTLGSKSGLTFSTGDGHEDSFMVFTATSLNTNAALLGMRFTPALNMYGVDYVRVTASDLGASGSGGALLDNHILAVSISQEIEGIDIVGTSSTTGVLNSCSEDGGSVTVDIVLTTRPAATTVVTVPVQSSTLSEATVSPPALYFTLANWNIPQSVVVTGVDDPRDDGDAGVLLQFLPAVGGDYTGVVRPSLTVTNLDNDVSFFNTSKPLAPVSEDGNTTTFTVSLTSEPYSVVTLTLSSSDSSEGYPSPAVLFFDATNWDVPRFITIVPFDDSLEDGLVVFYVRGESFSLDLGYDRLLMPDVRVLNRDNELTEMIQTTVPSGTVDEAGTRTVEFLVILNGPPPNGVSLSVDVSVSDLTEGEIVNATSLLFTASNWNDFQPVYVRGVDDDLDDGNVPFKVVLSAAGVLPKEVAVTCDDDDTAGIILSSSAVTVSELGNSVKVTIRLGTRPKQPVNIPLRSSNRAEVTVTPTLLTFLPAQWKTAKTIVIAGVPDRVADGNQVGTPSAVATNSTYNCS
jgi:cadherin-like protein